MFLLPIEKKLNPSKKRRKHISYINGIHIHIHTHMNKTSQENKPNKLFKSTNRIIRKKKTQKKIFILIKQ